MLKNKFAQPPNASIPNYRLVFVSVITLLCLAGVLLARLHLEQLSGLSLKLFQNTNGIYADWFLSCKESFYFAVSIGICAYTVGERIFPDRVCTVNPLYKRTALFPVICIGVYLLLSCISCLCSENREVVLRGVCTEFEGLSAIFSYCILFIFGFNFLSSETLLAVFQKLLLSLCAICAVLSIFEYIVTPLGELPVIQSLMAPTKYQNMAESLQHANTFRESMLMFHNSNYAGAFFVLMLPLPFSVILSEKPLVQRILSGVLCAALFVAGIMTNASASLYVMSAELVLFFAVLLLSKILRIKTLLFSMCLLIALLCGVDFCTGHVFFNTFVKSVVNAGTYTAGEQYPLREVWIDGNSLHIISDTTGYILTPPHDTGEILQFKAEEGTDYEVREQTANHLTIYDVPSEATIKADVQEGKLYVDAGYQSTLDFAITSEGLQLIVQNGCLLAGVPKAPMADSVLAKYNSVFTGRGYIWLNTIPILKSCLLLGKGAGNFPFYFTQNDVVGLCNTNGTYRLIIDKTHSMYLQIAVSSGIPALLCILMLFGSFLTHGLKCICFGKETIKNSNKIRMLLCLYTGTVGYMISGLVNDSTITVSPLFWIMLGTAYSLSVDMKRHD